MSRQAFERNFVSSRQCWSSQGGHYAPEIADLQFEVLKHPASSPDLALSDYYLFPNLKGRKLSSIEEATLAADRWFAAQPKDFSWMV
jgi:hypothetical protein